MLWNIELVQQRASGSQSFGNIEHKAQCDRERLEFIQYNTTLLPSVNTTLLLSVNTIALGVFCGAKYTPHTSTQIIKHSLGNI